MASENVKSVYRAYDAYQRGDLEAFVAAHDPECEILPRIVRVEGGMPYRGHDGVRAYWRDMAEAFEDWQPVAAEVRDHGDILIVRIRQSGHGRSGVAFVDEEFWQAIKMRNGLTVWWSTYSTEAEALEAVGLGERAQ